MSTFLRMLCLAVMVTMLPAHARADEMTPVVYTGQLHYASGQKNQLVRLFLIKRVLPGATAATTTALLELYMGQPGSPEYASLYYDVATFNPEERQLLLNRDDDLRGRRLPTVLLSFDEAGQVMKGSFTSQTEGYQGELDLKLGWDEGAKDDTLVDSLGGRYEASCNAKDGSALSIEDMELIPSRIFVDRLGSEGAFMQTNYIGTGLCPYTGPTVCASFTSGVYNFYTGRLTMLQGAWVWQCDRTAKDQLLCSSPRYPRCVLNRRYPIAAKQEPNQNEGMKAKAYTDAIPSVASGVACKDWNGTFTGIMNHKNTGRQQPVSLRLSAFSTGSSATAKCLVSGSAYLHFSVGDAWEKVTYPIPQFEIDPHESRQVLFSDNYTDLIIDLMRDASGKVAGHWYSKLFGYVGKFNLDPGTQFPTLNRGLLQTGLGGTYTIRGAAQRSLRISTIEAGFEKYSYDPYVQLTIGGNVRTYIDSTVYPRYITDGVQLGSYDFFTNFFVMRTNAAVYYGSVENDLLRLRGQPRTFLAPGHPIDLEYIFDRTKHPMP